MQTLSKKLKVQSSFLAETTVNICEIVVFSQRSLGCSVYKLSQTFCLLVCFGLFKPTAYSLIVTWCIVRIIYVRSQVKVQFTAGGPHKPRI